MTNANVESEWVARPVYYHPFQKITTTIGRTVVYIVATTTVTQTASLIFKTIPILVMHWPIRF